MDPEKHIEQMAGKDTGFKVPEGYFENLYASMPSRLPERELPPVVKMTQWQKIKPYIYLAAMFGGIWCMMKMFHTMGTEEISLENPPQEIVAAISEAPESFDIYVPEYASSDFELEMAVSEEYQSFDELSRDLNYKLEPEYAAIDVEASIAKSKAAAKKHRHMSKS